MVIHSKWKDNFNQPKPGQFEIKPTDIQVTKASLEQSSIIAQLYELYTYEMTDLADFDTNEDGFCRYNDLPYIGKIQINILS